MKKQVQEILDKLCDLMAITDTGEIEFLRGGLIEAYDSGKRGQKKKIKKLSEGLLFYACPDTYLGIGFLADPPCGDIVQDFSETEFGKKPGKRARQLLGYDE